MDRPSEQAPYLVWREPGYNEYQLPISFRAVVPWRGSIPLVLTHRGDWELPGGKLELDEEPLNCLRREADEEISWQIEIGGFVHHWVEKVRPDRHVFMVAHVATYLGEEQPKLSHEHSDVRLFGFDEALDESLAMRPGYRRAIRAALESSS